MESTEVGNVRRLERINRSLMIGAVVLVIAIVILALIDFA